MDGSFFEKEHVTTWTHQWGLQMLQQKSAPDTARASQAAVSCHRGFFTWWFSNSWATLWPIMCQAQTRLLLTPRLGTSHMSDAFSLTFGEALIPSFKRVDSSIILAQRTSSTDESIQMNCIRITHRETTAWVITSLGYHLVFTFSEGLYSFRNLRKMLSSQFNEVNSFLHPKSIACPWNGMKLCIWKQCVWVTGVLV